MAYAAGTKHTADMYVRLGRPAPTLGPAGAMGATLTEAIETSDQDQPHCAHRAVGLPAR